jgi:hypothetical protein
MASQRGRTWIVAAGALAPAVHAQGAAAASEWGLTLLAVGAITTIAGAVGGVRFSERWAIAHGHRATPVEKGLGVLLGALAGMTVPALLQLLILAGR